MLPWGQRHQIPLTRRQISTNLHGVIFRETVSHRRNIPIANQNCYHQKKIFFSRWSFLEFLDPVQLDLSYPPNITAPDFHKLLVLLISIFVKEMNVVRLVQTASGKINNAEKLSKTFRSGTWRKTTERWLSPHFLAGAGIAARCLDNEIWSSPSALAGFRGETAHPF